ncbi:beta-lactamase superfamily domain-containing protein, partial [Blyttiomyces helicus]
GQSTCFVQMDGFNILTDPIFSSRTIGEWFGPKRLRPAPCQLADLPKIDIVLVSHNHYDHLDRAIVKELGNSVKWYIPLGLREWFKKFGVTNVVELDWWQEAMHEGKLKIIGTPIQHWSGRHFFDVNSTLWCSFVVKGPNSSFFHCGDTGYCSAFKEIGRRFGPITLAAIPIGSYEPRWFLRHQHVNPSEACQIHLDLKSSHSIGVHWGTFMMSDEHYLDPKLHLEESRKRRGIPAEEVFTLRIGETLGLGAVNGVGAFSAPGSPIGGDVVVV